MNLFGFLRRKHEEPKRPLSEIVWDSLKICVEGMQPPVTDEEFEALYRDILDSEVHGRRNAAQIIDRFQEERKR